MRSAGCSSIARPVFGMTEIIPSAEHLSSYLWDTTLACSVFVGHPDSIPAALTSLHG
jgi:hypothetical protein